MSLKNGPSEGFPDSKPTMLDTIYSIFFRKFFLPFLLRYFRSAVASTELLRLHLPKLDLEFSFGMEKNSDRSEAVDLYLVNPIRFLFRVALDQRIGLGESYMAGDWNVEPTPQAFLNLLIRSKKNTSKTAQPRRNSISTRMLKLVGYSVRRFNDLLHSRRANTMMGSKKNIHDHYDLGNDMFKLFMDRSLTYSSGIFTDKQLRQPVLKFDEPILYESQMRKYDRIIELIQLKPTDHVLEIGCGWGGFAARAVQKTGCQWTGLTISKEQLKYTTNLMTELGLQDRVKIKFLDYRLEHGIYDKLVSVEMINAVGHDFLPDYFTAMRNCLKPGGLACDQVISIPDDQYERYRNASDFIKKHIFHGGHMPCERVIRQTVPHDLHVKSIDHIGLHYPPTLDHWYRAWMDNRSTVLELGYPMEFHRKWQYYFALCSALFANEHIHDVQIVFQRDDIAG